MKKKIILITILIINITLIIIGGIKLYNYIRIKNAKIEVILTDTLSLEFTDKKKVSDFISSINGKIIDDYIKLNSDEITFNVSSFNATKSHKYTTNTGNIQTEDIQ